MILSINNGPDISVIYLRANQFLCTGIAYLSCRLLHGDTDHYLRNKQRYLVKIAL